MVLPQALGKAQPIVFVDSNKTQAENSLGFFLHPINTAWETLDALGDLGTRMVNRESPVWSNRTMQSTGVLQLKTYPLHPYNSTNTKDSLLGTATHKTFFLRQLACSLLAKKRVNISSQV